MEQREERLKAWVNKIVAVQDNPTIVRNVIKWHMHAAKRGFGCLTITKEMSR